MIVPALVQVEGGRRDLVVGTFGDPGGTSVVFLHGALASWRYRHPDDAIAAKAGVRVVTMARPGFGASTRKPDRTVADTALDVIAVADALAMDSFAVIGHSGGGPHALACAALGTDRVTKVVAVGSLAPLESTERFVALGGQAQLLFETASTAERHDLEAGLQRVAAMFLLDPRQSVTAAFEGRAAGHEDELAADLVDALAHGVGGWADELRALTRPWGFDGQAAAGHVELWYGEDDDLRTTHGAALAETLRTEVRTHAGGHQGWLDAWPQLLAAATATMSERDVRPRQPS